MASSKAKKKEAARKFMSKDYSQDGYMVGAIIRIKMVNFVTYDCCEVFPGPHLNMIMGPNGTGKSTVVCAMCLGLNGSTNLLGRAKEIGEFVKRGTNKAVIELELYNTHVDKYGNRKNDVLRREITRQGNRSVFIRNNLPIKNREVTQFVREQNIQITNLCQFLPQEKVVEFSHMNNIELLERTEESIGSQGLYDDHQTLKACRNTEKELHQHLKDKSDHLEKLKQQNERVERDVRRFKERQKTLETIETLEKKKVWMQYDDKRVLFNKVKMEKKKAEEALAQMKRRADPLERELQAAVKTSKQLDQQKKNLSAGITEQEKLIKTKRDELGEQKGLIAELHEELRDKRTQEQKRLKAIHDGKEQVAGYERELDQLEPDEDIRPQLEENIGEINRVSQEKTTIEGKCSTLAEERSALKKEIRGYQDRLKRLNDRRDQRLRALKTRSPDTYNAVLWLRSNADKFKKTIHEPIALVLNIENKDHAKFIERSIPFQDMLAFVCEDSQDQDKFINEIREGQNLRVSVVKSPADPSESYTAQRPIQQLGFGFYAYLKDLVTAPNAVMAYLCKLHKLHNIPLGDENTERNVDKVIQHAQVNKFYTPKYQYTIKQSRYGNKNKSSLSSQVPPAKILGQTMDDMQEKRDLEKLIQEKEHYVQELEQEYAKLERQHKSLDAKLEQIKEARAQLKKRMNQRRTIIQNIKATTDKIKKKESMKIDLEAEKRKVEQKIQQINRKKLTILKKIHDFNKVCLEKSMQRVTLSLQQVAAEKAKKQCEENISETKNEIGIQENLCQELTVETDQVKKDAKQLLALARDKTGSDKPSDQLKKSFEQYPNDIEEVEDLIYKEKAQADCQFPTDEGVVRDYEKRKKEIRIVEAEVLKEEEEVSNHKARIDNLKETWLGELTGLVGKINSKFSKFFSTMGCAGEVDLFCPNEEDYDKYEMRIKVKFRRNEQLQLLTSTYQSGGERSVATVLYLMALQELNKCPFRVVDEINQGMDPSNERKVFEFVVETACRENTSQYFLITPKLLPDLKYGPRMKVLCVYNSHWMLSHEQWNIRKFIRRKEKVNEEAQDN
ncbi:structural maintenance of chromosomes protein 5 isoform X1 [Strongylocentrotus purpuratus]|uniref:Structural maintenance of chromosomes protein 5 n=1 Tax=Strongylocentrotus purpuratus TaxID=7668 RepID=A0A7M7N8A4_STRPU|nr:structural maintenance of chromosomes protein 5 isoform X1 [Strongylocentrotus purpuratus]